MGRYKPIDRIQVLEAAERLMLTKGISALTLDAVAKEAGVSKGGIQSAFGTKEQLLTALVERQLVGFDEQVDQAAGVDASPRQRLQAYVACTQHIKKADADRAASMMAGLLNAPAQLKQSQAWYQGKMQEFELSTPQARRARLAFLANEGVFILRYLGFMKISASEWKQIFSDLQELLAEPESPGRLPSA